MAYADKAKDVFDRKQDSKAPFQHVENMGMALKGFHAVEHDHDNAGDNQDEQCNIEGPAADRIGFIDGLVKPFAPVFGFIH